MNFKQFVHDHRAYIAVYIGFGLLAIGIVQLDLWLSGSSLQIGNILYIGLFGLIGLIVWLAFDYRRHLAFFQQFSEGLLEQSLDQMSVLDRPLTAEQKLYSEAWSALYGRLRSELVKERDGNRERIELITQWVHHLKTPVSVIDLELQKARHTDTPAAPEAVPDATPPDARLIASIAEENERLRDSLTMLLNMVRLDDFAADFKIEQVELIPAVREVINDHRRAFITHNVFPKIEAPDPALLPPRSLRVQSDAKWLRFVLDQIVRNAIQYSSRSDGHGNVNVSFHPGKSETILQITDDGDGIAPEDIGRVLTPFYTGTSGRSHRFATGMGLFLADKTCRRLGHRLTLQSSPGEGTCVRIHFPHDPSIYADLAAAAGPRPTMEQHNSPM